MHECGFCGQFCDCDGEDHGQSAPDDCTHWTECEAGDEILDDDELLEP